MLSIYTKKIEGQIKFHPGVKIFKMATHTMINMNIQRIFELGISKH
jgi:hypothetical protein